MLSNTEQFFQQLSQHMQDSPMPDNASLIDENPLVVAKLTAMVGHWAFYITHYDPESREAIGYSRMEDTLDTELQLLSLGVYANVVYSIGQGFALDTTFLPTRRSELIDVSEEG